ncbi:3-phosphoshikimate 1-carboxyvinyltransferase [Abditibacteriota bacterium]|nr:3-phosphoshikimate 1-carboxyvinyltransferase [Abditibacteriota bacterium]
MPNLLIHPVARPIDATVRVPGSKSITNRALLLAALCEGTSRLEGALFSDDTRYMSEALSQLGVPVTFDRNKEWFQIEGQGGRFQGDAELFLGNAGTAVRFLTAALCLGEGTFNLDGVPRMRQRPIGDLLGALRSLGAKILSANECLPLEIEARGLRGGDVSIRGDASSQFLSALLLVAPKTREGLEISIDGPLFSKPYVEMTLSMLSQWGATSSNENLERFHIPGGQNFVAQEKYQIEPDASGASYFFAAAAVTGGKVRVKNLGKDALQGDVEFVEVLAQMGCVVKKGKHFIEVRGPENGALRGGSFDMNAISDTVMTVAAIAPFASEPVEITNVAHIRGKETDRLKALSTELARLGVKVEERPDGLLIQPAKKLKRAAIKTYDDHRMAMSFAITGLKSPGVEIRDPGCVAKTFPDFFERLEKVAAKAR